MNCVERLAAIADADPDRIAIIDPSGGRTRQITFGQLWRRTTAGSTRLQGLGIRQGDALLLVQPISIELYEVMLSAFHAGFAVMLIDPSQPADFIDRCVNKVKPSAYIASTKAQLFRALHPAIRHIPHQLTTGIPLPLTSRWKVESSATSLPPQAVRPEAPALITFTSGSTGEPKGVVRSHAFLLAQGESIARALRLMPSQLDLVTLPIFVLANLSSGLTSLIADTDLSRPGFPHIQRLLKQAASYLPSRCTASPAFFEELAQHPAFFASIREIYTGGAPVFPNLIRRIASIAPQVSATAVYGSSEAEPIAAIRSDELTSEFEGRIRQGFGLPAGRAVEDIEVAILQDTWGTPLGTLERDEFDGLRLPADTPGEIVVRGEHVLSGYLGGIGEELVKFRVGNSVWHRTGDAGCLDHSGRLWLAGRCSAAIKLKARRAYPLQVEAAVLQESTSIRRCAYLEVSGKKILAYESSHSDEAITLPVWAEVDQTVRIDRIPVDKRHNAKIDYTALRSVVRAALP